ncbi:MAG: glycosyltransferase family 2 protein [candidate division FCPU426 bacterium]
MNPDSVWAVVLSWNGREDTLACLATLESQTRPPDRIIVVDNGSTDGLEAPLRAAYPRVEYVFQPVNVGFAGGMNIGLRRALEAGADYVVTPSNDTLLKPDCLEKMLDALRGHPQAGAVAPKIFYYEPAGTLYFNGGYFTRATLRPCHPGELKPDPNPQERAAREIGFLNGCCPLFRAAALKQTGLFDEAFHAYFEDADLSLRLLKDGWTLLLAPQAVVIHHHAVSFKKNAGPALQGTVSRYKWFIATRNRFWLLRKHGRWWQIMLGYLTIVVTRIAIIFTQVILGRPNKALGIIKGLWSGLMGHIPSRIR